MRRIFSSNLSSLFSTNAVVADQPILTALFSQHKRLALVFFVLLGITVALETTWQASLECRSAFAVSLRVMAAFELVCFVYARENFVFISRANPGQTPSDDPFSRGPGAAATASGSIDGGPTLTRGLQPYQLYGWGLASDGRCGVDPQGKPHLDSPTLSLQGQKVLAVSASGHTLAILEDGTVVSVGRNDSAGGGGGGSKVSLVLLPAPLRQIDPGGERAPDSKLIPCFGSLQSIQGSGQLGRGGTGSDPGPVNGGDMHGEPLRALLLFASLPDGRAGSHWNTAGAKAVAVCSGRYHSAAVTSEGLLVTWGLNDFGQLGRKGTETSTGSSCSSGAECRDGTPKRRARLIPPAADSQMGSTEACPCAGWRACRTRWLGSAAAGITPWR